jgi:phosphatidylserine/phosphatidylglycerophosphate/cardiolipin synthase-like enzyme
MTCPPEQRSSLPRPARLLGLTTVLGLLAGLLVLAGPVVPAQADWYKPPPGVLTNNPLGTQREKRVINRHLRRTVDSVMKREQIRFASWNIRNDSIVDALIDAHHRGVSVRVIVDRGNANPDNPNQGVDRLEEALSGWGNKWRKPQFRSGLRRCVSACRGRYGIAHSKFFVFSQAGPARWVVINGSANATELAATHQWNDVYTTRGREGIYREFATVFDQMYADRPREQGYRIRRFKQLDTLMLPWTGSYTNGDPTMRDLNDIRCWGATNTGNGRTKVQIAMTSWHGDRGIRLAKKVRRLYDNGCNVKIIYAVMGNRILQIMRTGQRGRIPFRQVVEDFDGDGVYDRYLHTKVMTVRGRFRKDRNAWVTVNGSMNWSPVPLASDEAIMRIRSKAVVQRYNRYVDYWFANTPTRAARVSGRKSASTTTAVTPRGVLVDGVDPYAKLQEH